MLYNSMLLDLKIWKKGFLCISRKENKIMLEWTHHHQLISLQKILYSILFITITTRLLILQLVLLSHSVRLIVINFPQVWKFGPTLMVSWFTYDMQTKLIIETGGAVMKVIIYLLSISQWFCGSSSEWVIIRIGHVNNIRRSNVM